jgi:hypothetical protein
MDVLCSKTRRLNTLKIATLPKYKCNEILIKILVGIFVDTE